MAKSFPTALIFWTYFVSIIAEESDFGLCVIHSNSLSFQRSSELSVFLRFINKESMSKVFAIAILVALMPFIYCQCLTRDDTAIITADKLYHGQRKFSVNLLDALQKTRRNESLFFSPHSTYRVLLLAYFGASGETEKSLHNTLHLSWAKSKADVSHAYEVEKIARAHRTHYQTVEFDSVDKLYFSKTVEVK